MHQSLFLVLSTNNTTTQLTDNQYQHVSADHSLDHEDDFHTDCQNVSRLQQTLLTQVNPSTYVQTFINNYDGDFDTSLNPNFHFVKNYIHEAEQLKQLYKLFQLLSII